MLNHLTASLRCSRLDCSDPILKRGYTEFGVDAHKRRQPHKSKFFRKFILEPLTRDSEHMRACIFVAMLQHHSDHLPKPLGGPREVARTIDNIPVPVQPFAESREKQFSDRLRRVTNVLQ